MRGAWPTGLLLLPLSFSAGCFDQTPAPIAPPQEAAPPAAGGVPSWVPAYTPQQTALLTPSNHPVKAPAQRVFPSLDRFAYANNRKLENVEDAVKFTRMVTKVLNDSPRFYVLGELPPGAANPIVQYGPPPTEPDGYKVVKRLDEGMGQLLPAVGAEEARVAVAEGDAKMKAGDVAGAILSYDTPGTAGVPAVHMARAKALAASGNAMGAEAEYRKTIAIDPTYAPAHLALAEIAEKRNDLPAARHELAEALAFDPPSARGLDLLRKLAGGAAAGVEGGWYDPPAAPPAAGAGGRRGEPFPLFLDVDAAGAIHVASGKSDAAQIYGGCRAVLRYEPELRAQIFQQPREAPYALSVAEEVICVEAALGAYAASKGAADPAMEDLMRLARQEGLSGYVMFEILGQHRPERARTAPADVHLETVGYLARWVMSRQEAVPEGVYTAER